MRRNVCVRDRQRESDNDCVCEREGVSELERKRENVRCTVLRVMYRQLSEALLRAVQETCVCARERKREEEKKSQREKERGRASVREGDKMRERHGCYMQR